MKLSLKLFMKLVFNHVYLIRDVILCTIYYSIHYKIYKICFNHNWSKSNF